MTKPVPEQHDAMWYIAPLLLLVLGATAFVGLRMLRSRPVTTNPPRRAPLVETELVVTYNEELPISVDGEVIPYREISLAAEVAGRVLTKSPECQAGNYVQQGALLLQIDPRDYDLSIRRLDAMARQADATIKELEVDLQNADDLLALADEEIELQQNELARIQTLYQQGVASDSERDTARRAVLHARNARQAITNQRRQLAARRTRLETETERMAAELDKAQLDRQRTEIRAPIDGVIIQDAIEQNGYVSPGTTLVRMEDASKVEVRFNLRMSQLRWLWDSRQSLAAATSRPDQVHRYDLAKLPATVSLLVDGQTFEWRGRLSRYDDAGIHSATRTVPCIAVVDHPAAMTLADGAGRSQQLAAPPALMRGMFVTVTIHVPSRARMLAVPENAIRPGSRIWALQDGRLAVVPAPVILTAGGAALLLADGSALRPGDRVVVSPLAMAVDGMQLRTKADDSAAPAKVADVAREKSSKKKGSPQ